MAAGQWSGSPRRRAYARRGAGGDSLAIGWGARDAATRGATVVAAFDRDGLGNGLARLHGQGFGPSARVFDGARGNLADQLARAGLPAELADRLVQPDERKRTSLLVVHAPARSATVVDLLNLSGAIAVEVVSPDRPAVVADAPLLEIVPNAPHVEAGM